MQSSALSYPFIAAAAFVLAANASAHDDQRADRERQMMRRLQAQMQQAEREKAELRAHVAELEGKLKDAQQSAAQAGKRAKTKDRDIAAGKAEAARLQREKAALGESLNAAMADIERQKQALEESRKQMADRDRRVAERDERIRELTARLESQRAVLARQVTILEGCETKNMALYRIGTDLLGEYKQKGVFDALLQKEPFTQIERVRMENLLQEYEEKLQANEIEGAKVGG